MDPNEGLATSRARRANAGSRLKHLIELEEAASGVQQTFLTEEDEDVQLLFQEDENDAEFEDEEEGEEDEGEEDEEEEGEVQEKEGEEDVDDPQKEAAQLLEEDKSEAEANPDEMLSDSDLSVSEDDESEGERELQKEEKSKKRRKKQTIIPAIKKRATQTPKPKEAPKPTQNAALYGERRASSRKSAVKNKEVLLKKLKADETRRAALTPIVRVKEREPTQEERLAQAQETEKENILSLHAFLEQEIVKKERQKMMFQLKRQKLRNVIRLVSRATFVTPLDEVEDARHVQDMFERKRRGRRRKNVQDEPDVRRPGDVDTELPYYKAEMAERQRLEVIRLEEKRKLEEARAIKREKLEKERAERKQKLEEEREERRKLKEQRLKEFENIDATDPNFSAESLRLKGELSSLEDQDREADERDKADKEESEREDNQEAQDKLTENGSEDNPAADITEKEIKQETVAEIEKAEALSDDHKEKSAEVVDEKTPETKDVEMTDTQDGNEEVPEASAAEKNDDKQNADDETKEKEASVTVEGEPEKVGETSDKDTPRNDTETVKVEKKVTFSEDVGKEENDDSEKKQETEEDVKPKEEESPEVKSVTPVYKPRSDGKVFEGPVQYVSRNLLFLLDFDEEDRYWKLPETKMKIALFGEESVLSASRRFRDVKTILRSTSRNENPYATSKDDREDEFFQLVADITEDSPMFDDLKKLRKIGVRVEDEESEEEEDREEENVVQISTEAPSGLYLPNGNKKICLISGKEVRYFDPDTGVPYDNVKDYKVIKDIRSGIIPWYSIARDQNTYGAVEIYLNNREGNRHALGVPEGFDGC